MTMTFLRKMNDKFIRAIQSSDYVKKTKRNEKINFNSISYLLSSKNISQSDKIKIGIALEKLTTDIIMEHSTLKNIKQKNKKGSRERDHVFKDEENKIIYYAELKSNFNLDTEKSKCTYLKCLEIEKELKQTYNEYKIVCSFVNLRFLYKEDIPNTILKKYKLIDNYILGLNEYFELLSIDYNISNYSYYSNILDTLYYYLFKN